MLQRYVAGGGAFQTSAGLTSPPASSSALTRQRCQLSTVDAPSSIAATAAAVVSVVCRR